MKSKEKAKSETKLMKEKYYVLNNIVFLIENNLSSLDDISNHLGSLSPSITHNYLLYINKKLCYSSRKKLPQKIHTLEEGLKYHGINPLLDVILNMKNSTVPENFFFYFSVLSNNVFNFLTESFNDKITNRLRSRAQTYSLLFGQDALMSLEEDYILGKRQDPTFHKFQDKDNIDQPIEKKDNLPAYLFQRADSPLIKGVSFSNYDITSSMNLYLALNKIGFSSSNILTVNSKMLEDKKTFYQNRLEHILNKIPELEILLKYTIKGGLR